jgi:F0F1-type ATP synthase membrane subunit b/b'
MANTINDLYLKYVNKVGKTLEKDRYFQYLFEMVQAGSNVLQQKNQVLHKVVDERWLTTIEESLDAINTIIEKPRRFVTTTEEVVPVALARKITADSVRHLSQNTQFIASNEDGNIQPTKVLNITTEESYDLYENRFIYHLIQRLVTFIDKRTDVIFWSTGDETRNTLSYQSKVDDAYEEIEYKIELSVKNRQSFAENDSDNMQVFMRIDRVRRLVMALRSSSFCSIMAGCAKVRSPIQRTNLMMKDPNYRTCYKLWQFLESYEEVGYTIEARDTALEFDEEYLYQLYTNLITNYTVFKSLLEEVPRKLEETPPQRRRVVKPKFVRRIEEQIVDDCDIPDVEIRKVFVEEVTQAQLDAEAKLTETQAELQETQEALESMESQMMALQQQVLSLTDLCSQAKDQAQQAQTQAQAEIAQAKAQAETEIRQAKEQADAEIAEAKSQAEQEISKTKAQADAKIAAAQEKATAEVAEHKAQAEREISETKSNAEQEIAATKSQAETEIAAAQEKAAQEVAAAQAKLEEALAAQELAQAQMQAALEAQKLAEQAMTQAQQAQAAAETEAEAQRQRADQEAKARAKAQEKADANSLSKYIITALNNRKQP